MISLYENGLNGILADEMVFISLVVLWRVCIFYTFPPFILSFVVDVAVVPLPPFSISRVLVRHCRPSPCWATCV